MIIRFAQKKEKKKEKMIIRFFFFFFFLNESFIKPNTNYNHTREIWFKLFHGQIESPKRAHSKALKTKTKCRRQSAASYTS